MQPKQNYIIKSILNKTNILHTLQTDKEKSFRILSQRPELVKYINERFLDFKFIKKVSHANPYIINIFNFIPEDKISKELLYHCLDNYLNVDTIQNLLIKYSDDKKYIIKLLYKNSDVLKYMPYEIKDDFEFLYPIAKNDMTSRHIFRHASSRIRNTKEYLIKFLMYGYSCMEHTDEKFFDDEDVILCLLKYNWYDMIDCSICLSYLTILDKMLQNKEIAYWAIGIVPFFRLPKSVREDRDMILKAIKRESYILKFIPIDTLVSLNLMDEAETSVSNIDGDFKTDTDY